MVLPSVSKPFLAVCLTYIILSFTYSEVSSAGSDMSTIMGMSLEDLLNIDVAVWSVSRSDEGSASAPATVVVVGKRKIKERGYRDLVDALRDLPGFDIMESAGRFGEYYTIRGIQGNDRFLVLVDGHRINPNQGTFLSTGNSISIRYAEQIEIVYGPSSVTFGADAFAAIINIVTPHTSETSSPEGSVYLAGGQESTKDIGFEGVTPLAGKNGSLYISGRQYTSDGVDLSARDTAFSTLGDFDQAISDHTLNARLRYKQVEVGYFKQSFNEGNGVGHNPAIYEMSNDNVWKTSTDIFWLNYDITPKDTVNVHMDLSYTKHIQDPDTLFKKQPAQYFTGEDKTLKASSTLNYRMANDTQLVAGAEIERTESIPPYANDQVFGTGNSVQFSGSNETRIREELTVEEVRLAGYSQLAVPLYDNLSLTAGFRYDYSDEKSNSFNPRGNLIYTPNKKTTLKFIYGTAFQAPSLFYQYEQFVVPSSSLIMIPNTKLENQELESYELSLTQRLTDNAVINVSLYNNSLSNLIYRSNSDVEVDGFSTVLQNTNIGTQESFGTDMRLDAVVNEKSEISLFYSYIHSHYDLSGESNDTPRVSTHKSGLSYTYKPTQGFLTTLQVRWVSPISTHELNSRNPVSGKQSGHYLLNVFMKYRVLKTIALFAKLENLPDNDIEHGGLFGQSGPYTPSLYQPGFNGTLGIDVEF